MIRDSQKVLHSKRLLINEHEDIEPFYGSNKTLSCTFDEDQVKANKKKHLHK